MTFTYSLTSNQIISKAFSILGVGSEGEALTPRMYSDGLSSLNLLMMTLESQPHLWTLTEATLTLIADTAEYIISPKPMRVVSMRRRQNGIDTPLTEWSRQEYFDQPTKTVSPSVPVNFYYNPQQSTGTIYLWPAPSAQSATQYTMPYTYWRRLSDVVNSNDEPDIPQEWLQTLVWGLASDLEVEYPVNDPNVRNKIDGKAAMLKAQIMAFDNEPASLFMSPDRRWSNGDCGGY